MQSNKERLIKINTDIINCLDIAHTVGWEGIKDFNLHRVIYISSVLYSFRNINKSIFDELYNFNISLRGPHSHEISQSLSYLIGQNLIVRQNDELLIDLKKCERIISQIERINNSVERKEWISIVISIIARYGESKIYDFVFRDPEYQNNLKRNSHTNLNIGEGNKTEKNIIEMKHAFEKALGEDAKHLTNKKYLELYFEFVFSKIIKGDR